MTNNFAEEFAGECKNKEGGYDLQDLRRKALLWLRQHPDALVPLAAERMIDYVQKLQDEIEADEVIEEQRAKGRYAR
jgi:hypothetical protein